MLKESKRRGEVVSAYLYPQTLIIKGDQLLRLVANLGTPYQREITKDYGLSFVILIRKEA